MDRRNFLAFIPTLSAIPFIGKDIVKTESGILIADPVPHVKPGIVATRINPMDLEVRLFSEGKHVGNAFISAINFSSPIESTCRDDGGIPMTPFNMMHEMSIECRVIDPEQLLKGIYGG
jgi:hypothetical protein